MCTYIMRSARLDAVLCICSTIVFTHDIVVNWLHTVTDTHCTAHTALTECDSMGSMRSDSISIAALEHAGVRAPGRARQRVR